MRQIGGMGFGFLYILQPLITVLYIHFIYVCKKQSMINVVVIYCIRGDGRVKADREGTRNR